MSDLSHHGCIDKNFSKCHLKQGGQKSWNLLKLFYGATAFGFQHVDFYTCTVRGSAWAVQPNLQRQENQRGLAEGRREAFPSENSEKKGKYMLNTFILRGPPKVLYLIFPKMLPPFHQILVSTRVSETLTLEKT